MIFAKRVGLQPHSKNALWGPKFFKFSTFYKEKWFSKCKILLWLQNGGWGDRRTAATANFFSQNAQDCSHSQNFRVYQSAGVRESITSSLKTRQNPYKQSLFGEIFRYIEKY